MLEGIDYSEKDAEFDSQLVFKEIEDLHPVTSMGNSLKNGQEATAGQRIHSAIMTHLRNIRYAKFSREALRTELGNLRSVSRDVHRPNFNASWEELTQSEFKHRLLHYGRIHAVLIPNVQQMVSEAGLVRVDASMKQLKKDIERDRLLVNGVRLVGAEAGLDAIISSICGICDNVLSECSVPTLGDEVKEFLVLSLLSKASRSHSGGIAFQAAQSLIDPSTAMLMPQSAVAPPLKINIHLGAFPTLRSEECANKVDSQTDSENESSSATNAQIRDKLPNIKTTDGDISISRRGGKWGLVCKITAESIFKVQLYDTPAADGYDDCSTNDTVGEDGSPCMFRPVSVPSVSALASASTGAAPQVPADDAVREEGAEAEGQPSPLATPAARPQPSSSSTPHAHSAQLRGVSLEGRNTYASVIYEDYVLFEVKLAPSGELANLENLYDNWKETATVTVAEIEPVRTLM